MKKILPYLMLVSVLVSGVYLCACGAGVPGQAQGQGDTDGYVIDGSNVGNYQILRSDLAEGDLVHCGMDIRAAFEAAGMDLKLGTDFFREGNPAFAMGEFEILVGATNRPESIEFLDGLQAWQYGYALVGKKLVIAGHDDASTRLAVDEFRTFLAERTAEGPFSFSAADNFVYGEVKEGEGKIYSVLLYDFTQSGETDVNAEIAAYSPDFVILQNADFAAAETLPPDGYALGADYSPDGSENGRRELMYYHTETYTYSAEGALELSRLPMLTPEEKGWFSYCVVRCAETKEKYVFCSADLSGVPENGIADRLEVFGDFADNCGELHVLFGGFYDGFADGPACGLLTEYGYADAMRLAAETEGECTEQYLYASYDNIAVVKSAVTDHGLYAEFQRAK